VRILFVTLADSVHAARWIKQLQDQKWDIHVFPHSEHEAIHPELCGVTFHNLIRQPAPHKSLRIRQTGIAWPMSRGMTRTRKAFQRFGFLQQAARLKRLIRTLKPDFIHILEMQRAGYMTLACLDQFPDHERIPPVIYSSWGSDIFHFGRKPEHQDRIRRFLAKCDYVITDCYRDIALAREFGFKGEVLGVFPVGGGFDFDQVCEPQNQVPTAARRVVALKGYDGGDWGGRASVALEAFSLCSDHLGPYEIVVYSGGSALKERAERISTASGLNFTFLPHTSHSRILNLFARSRLAIGLSTTDGTPNSMLEAMVMGAFPIQSDTISTGEWIKDARNGFLVPAEDPHAVARAIKHALSDDELVNRAERLNARITRRIGKAVIQPQVIEMYRNVAYGAHVKSVRQQLARDRRQACAY
jgi:glycosyltransferase involved in cell wall biosynthesis